MLQKESSQGKKTLSLLVYNNEIIFIEKYKNLPSTESEHWSIWISVIHANWQQLLQDFRHGLFPAHL